MAAMEFITFYISTSISHTLMSDTSFHMFLHVQNRFLKSISRYNVFSWRYYKNGYIYHPETFASIVSTGVLTIPIAFPIHAMLFCLAINHQNLHNILNS